MFFQQTFVVVQLNFHLLEKSEQIFLVLIDLSQLSPQFRVLTSQFKHFGHLFLSAVCTDRLLVRCTFLPADCTSPPAGLFWFHIGAFRLDCCFPTWPSALGCLVAAGSRFWSAFGSIAAVLLVWCLVLGSIKQVSSQVQINIMTRKFLKYSTAMINCFFEILRDFTKLKKKSRNFPIYNLSRFFFSFFTINIYRKIPKKIAIFQFFWAFLFLLKFTKMFKKSFIIFLRIFSYIYFSDLTSRHFSQLQFQLPYLLNYIFIYYTFQLLGDFSNSLIANAASAMVNTIFSLANSFISFHSISIGFKLEPNRCCPRIEFASEMPKIDIPSEIYIH
ncbi:hypothetical protein BpHYR1_040973 [Brachionus plicatilis]|uniref:Uncharacterized protein n=1 Tax=Brachionus plicatilis TaxID=10195 RepID=A0A3M7SDX5_BRAPC|nr:hypothetical protein BpHYR1_040973 [Brachionus plicatilis]